MLNRNEIEILKTEKGNLLRFKNPKKRSKLNIKPAIVRILRDREFLFKANIFNYIINFLLNLKDSSLKASNIDKPLLIELIQLNCECSRSRAREYADFLICLWHLRDIL